MDADVLVLRGLRSLRAPCLGKLARIVLITSEVKDPQRGRDQPDQTGDWHDHRVQCGAGKHQDCA